MKILNWLDWSHWGLALDSDERYAPKWYEFRAYAMGLRDAARIIEGERWKAGDIAVGRINLEPDRASDTFGRRYIKAIHARVLAVLGLPPEQFK